MRAKLSSPFFLLSSISVKILIGLAISHLLYLLLGKDLPSDYLLENKDTKLLNDCFSSLFKNNVGVVSGSFWRRV
jgi:hypothetical protein